MPTLMEDIQWEEPIFTITEDHAWAKTVKARLDGQMPALLKVVAPSEWLRNACLNWPLYKVTTFPERLADIATLVVAQENACRYCYGIARAQLKLFGYPNRMINKIENGLLIAELDERERTFIQFCRNLARSSPRPPKREKEKLIESGYSELTVAEMAFYIANHCFVNRVAIFLACPLFSKLEQVSNSFLAKILRPIIERKIRRNFQNRSNGNISGDIAYPGVVQSLKGLPAASLLYETMMGALSSNVLSRELKVLMFAVVARSLECPFCMSESMQMASELGIEEKEFEEALSSLNSPRLSAEESIIFAWTRETVHFETGDIQQKIKAISEQVDNLVLLEAIGMASLANTIVRLAVLL